MLAPRPLSVAASFADKTEEFDRATKLIGGVTKLVEGLDRKHRGSTSSFKQVLQRANSARERLVRVAIETWLSHNFMRSVGSSSTTGIGYGGVVSGPISAFLNDQKRQRTTTTTPPPTDGSDTLVAIVDSESDEQEEQLYASKEGPRKEATDCVERLITRKELLQYINHYLKSIGLPAINQRTTVWLHGVLRECLGLSEAEWKSGRRLRLIDCRTLESYENSLVELLAAVRAERQDENNDRVLI